jgi:YVTN family beta-propeller protein
MQFKLIDPRRAFTRLAQVLLIVLIIHLTAAAQTLLVASNAEHHVALINPATFETVARLPTGQGPHEITLSHDGRLAYVVDSGTGPNGIRGNTITVLDLPNRRVKATFNLGAFVQPHDTRLSRNGRLLWVTCALAQTILELDANDGKILKTYAIRQEGAWFLAATPDGRKLYTANLEGKSVSRIERATGQVQVISLAAEVTGIDMTPSGREVWVTSGSVHVIDTTTDRVVAALNAGDGGTNRIRLTSNGKYAVVSLRAKNELAVFDVKARRLLARIPLTLRPKVITLSKDGRQAFLTNPADNRVTVVDLNARKQTATYPVGKTPDGIAWAGASPLVLYNNEHPAYSPDGRQIVFASNRHGDNEIFVMNADGSNQRRLTTSPGRDAHPQFSPNGKKIAFQSPRGGDGSDTNLYVMNADGSQQVKITNHKGFAGVPCWSPDGKHILYQWRDDTTNDKRWHIYLVNTDGLNPRRLSSDAANNQVPNWSPDGKRILFYSDKTGNNQIYVMNADGSNVTRVTNNGANDYAAFWSRDGKRIVFCSDRDGSREVYTMNADGSMQRRVTSGATAFQSSWSPDGRRILFTSIRDNRSEIYTVEPDGSGLTRLTDTSTGH